MKRFIGIGVLALALTGCIQDKIDNVEDSCQAAADKAEASCERMIDEALDQFWEQLEKELRTTFEDVGCVQSGPGDLEYDCSSTFLCPDKGE
jgi:hypothetical protein